MAPPLHLVVWYIVLLISIGRMPLLATTLDNVDSHFALVITPGFYLKHEEVANQDQLVAVYKHTGR